MASLCCHYLTIEFTVVPRKSKKCVAVVLGGSMCFFTVRDLYTTVTLILLFLFASNLLENCAKFLT